MGKFLKWLGIIILLFVVAIAVIYFKGQSHLNTEYTVTGNLTSVTADSLALEKGRHIAAINGCNDCHGLDYSGQVFVDAPPFIAVASNLTSGEGGIGSRYTDSDWDRAIRYGVRPDGTALIVMPSKTFHNLSDEDANALISFIKTVPAKDNVLPKTNFSFLGSFIAGLGELDLSENVHTQNSRESAPMPDSSAAYGKYLASITCMYCHGTDLAGQPAPEPGLVFPSLENAAAWDFSDFETLLRTGINPDGNPVNEMMPRIFKNYTDTEIKAVFAYLNSVKF